MALSSFAANVGRTDTKLATPAAAEAANMLRREGIDGFSDMIVLRELREPGVRICLAGGECSLSGLRPIDPLRLPATDFGMARSRKRRRCRRNAAYQSRWLASAMDQWAESAATRILRREEPLQSTAMQTHGS
jgi:hypothetical protein